MTIVNKATDAVLGVLKSRVGSRPGAPGPAQAPPAPTHEPYLDDELAEFARRRGWVDGSGRPLLETQTQRDAMARAMDRDRARASPGAVP